MLAHIDESSVVKLLKITELIGKHKKFLIVAVVLLAIPSYFVYDYTQHNPKFCTSCHLMDEAYDTWDVSAMHDLNCHSCHESDIATSMDHLREVLFENPNKVTKMTVIDNEACEDCHANNDPQWLQVANTAGHRVHIYLQEEAPECIGCHGIQLHVFEPPEETCYDCHSHDHDAASELMDAHCIVCHEFTTTEHELIPQRDDCLQCHEGQETMGVSFPSAAHNNTACENCHNPHLEEQHTECSTCHTESLGGGLHVVSAHDNCINCHVPHSSGPMSVECLSCHVDKTEHGGTAACSVCHGFGA
jgi:hypothetical protein